MLRALRWLALAALVIAGWLFWRASSQPPVPVEVPEPAVASAPARAPEAPPLSGVADPIASLDEGGEAGFADDPLAPAPDADSADARAEIDRAFMQSALEGALAEHLASVKLSPDQMEELSAAALALRNSREALRTLPVDAEHAEERRALLEVSAEANETFRRILDMTPDEFTAVVQPEEGVSTFSPDDPIPDPEFIEEPIEEPEWE